MGYAALMESTHDVKLRRIVRMGTVLTLMLVAGGVANLAFPVAVALLRSHDNGVMVASLPVLGQLVLFGATTALALLYRAALVQVSAAAPAPSTRTVLLCVWLPFYNILGIPRVLSSLASGLAQRVEDPNLYVVVRKLGTAYMGCAVLAMLAPVASVFLEPLFSMLGLTEDGLAQGQPVTALLVRQAVYGIMPLAQLFVVAIAFQVIRRGIAALIDGSDELAAVSSRGPVAVPVEHRLDDNPFDRV